MAKAIVLIEYDGQKRQLMVDGEGNPADSWDNGRVIATLCHGSGWDFVAGTTFLGKRTDVSDVARLVVTSISPVMVMNYSLSSGEAHSGVIASDTMNRRVRGFSVSSFTHKG